ncbi:peptidylprolyl isomerase [Aquimarina sp. AD10]|uniref:peptidylprolyl isomerase n=1 Tax=Aquimarina sp. AD10 TaxID=1714849 RepID=UPI000E476A38|nr:peptidylprolyl isomerase [Aquimarina sp. AD10]AXT60598.1 peptidylprolyl isomerase [Aquimarina sp. AD10]RKN01691.1 peptidylprolyl isomerase [Aquimarina sp. AD10]
MRTKSLVFLFGFIFLGLANAQQKEEVLLSIDNLQIPISEFKRIYLKNIDLVTDDSQKDVDEYLDLFINYKLKLREAQTLGLDKKDSYLKELEGYKKQLSSSYLTDTRTSEALIKEAYDRSQERINASHILVMVKPNASAKDTLQAYQKILEAKEKIKNGKEFATVANAYSEDPSVAKNNGLLGWFSTFRMVYPFEDAAYKTKVGEVSNPFRTQFGYHIVKVNKREKKLGEVSVAHIMIAINDKRTSQEAEQRIKEINQQLDQGVSFESLAKQYSDDPSTAVQGGKIRRFGQGILNSEKFEKTAFALQKKGELSEPLETKYGWHIIKLIEKHAPKSFEEQKNELTNRVKKDSRSKLVTESFINSLKEKYQVTFNTKAVSFFKEAIPDSMNFEGWDVSKNEGFKKELFRIKDQPYTYGDFGEFLKENARVSQSYSDKSIFIEKMYAKYESTTLLKYYEEHLENDNQDYANVINEYRDGLLLFDLMESKIWNASKTDTIGLKKYYEEHKDEYVQNETYKVLRASSSKREALEKVKKLLEKKVAVEEIKKEVNKGDIVLVLFSEEELIKGEDKLPKNFKAQEDNITLLQEDNFATLILVKEVLPSRVKTFEETKGELINNFQEDIERKWLDELKDKYAVKVNQKALKKIKKELLK